MRALNKAFDWNLPSDGPKTLNGIVLEHFENFPDEGAVFSFQGRAITVLAVATNRVTQVRIDGIASDALDTEVTDERSRA